MDIHKYTLVLVLSVFSLFFVPNITLAEGQLLVSQPDNSSELKIGAFECGDTSPCDVEYVATESGEVDSLTFYGKTDTDNFISVVMHNITKCGGDRCEEFQWSFAPNNYSGGITDGTGNFEKYTVASTSLHNFYGFSDEKLIDKGDVIQILLLPLEIVNGIGQHRTGVALGDMTSVDGKYFIEIISTNKDESEELLTEIASPGKKMVITGTKQQAIDTSKPTIIITHGLQPNNYDEVSADGNFNELFSGYSSKEDEEGMGFLIRQQLGDTVNIIQFIWPQAFQTNDSKLNGIREAKEGYLRARPYADDAGVALAKYLYKELGDSYNQSIHFIGHSLGTIVNAHAARMFLDIAEDVPRAQVTMLDYPNRAPEEPISETFFATLLQPIQNKKGISEFKIDNYYSSDILAFGNSTQGSIYNHVDLNSPNDVGDEIFSKEEHGTMSDHTGVHQWYRWTINPNGLDDTLHCNSDGSFNDPGVFFSETLNPCNRGWYWSLFGEREWYAGNSNEGGWDKFPSIDTYTTSKTKTVLKLGTPDDFFGCQYNNGIIICEEQSSPFISFNNVNIPQDAEYLSFDYKFSNIGDGDYAAFLIDGEPLWTLAGDSALFQDRFANTGPIPITKEILEGTHQFTIVLYGVGEKNAVFEVKNLQTISTQLLNARSLKEAAINRLDSMEVTDRRTKRSIARISKLLRQSLKSNYWVGDDILQYPSGTNVFRKNAAAISTLQNLIKQSEKRKFTSNVYNALNLSVQDLVESDKILAEVAFKEAQTLTTSGEELSQTWHKRLLEQANKMMQQANDGTDNRPSKRVIFYGSVWRLSNLVMSKSAR